MYDALLFVHSLIRWLVIFSGLAAAAIAVRSASAPERRASQGPGLVFTILFDIQVLVGLLLYVAFSPVTREAIHRLGAAMSNDVARFWTVEHPVGMIVALVLAHLARARSRSAAAPVAAPPGTSNRARRRAALYFSLALLIVLLSVPWPFMPYGRPLLDWPFAASEHLEPSR